MEDTLEGIRQIAEAQALDVISLGIDQDAQENFFHPERQNPRRTGAGGVPVRSADDYAKLYAASPQRQLPLMRTYSGTDDFIRLAEMYIEHHQQRLVRHPAVLVQPDGRARSLGPGRLDPSSTSR